MPDPGRVLVIGGGPAGMAAARAALRQGATVTLLEAGDDLGGQFWRHLPERRRGADEYRLHHHWREFQTRRRELLDDPGCEVVLNAHVWSMDRRDDAPPVVHVMVGPADGNRREPRVYRPERLVIATGGQERTLPFPGWDRPGVFTAGAAQALAKGERVAVGRRVLVAGAGPFLLPVASSLLRTGAQVVGVVEASDRTRLAQGWLTRPWELVETRSKSGELAGYVKDLARHRIPYHTGQAVIAAHGEHRVESVTLARIGPDWSPVPGTERTVAVDALCVSHGFVPRAELAIASGCRLGTQGFVETDTHQRTSTVGVLVAGELTGIGGADLALIEGEIAGTVAAGGTPDPRRLRRREVHQGFARRLEAAHGIRDGWQRWVTPETLVCRCEDVTAEQLCRTADLTGATGLRSLKLTTRAGLGPCQGRTCGRNVEDLLGARGPVHGSTSHRPIAIPVRLGELAATVSSEREDPS